MTPFMITIDHSDSKLLILVHIEVTKLLKLHWIRVINFRGGSMRVHGWLGKVGYHLVILHKEMDKQRGS